MGLQLATVADSISKLSISGLVIEDVDDMHISYPDTTATLAPLDTFISNFELEYDSQGSGDMALMTVHYDLTYRLHYKRVGADRDLKAVDGLTDMVVAILDAVISISTLTGAVEILPMSVKTGVVAAPDGTGWFGADFVFRVMEFYH